MSVDPEPAGLAAGFGIEISAGLGSLRSEMREMRRDMRRQWRNEVPRDRREIFFGIGSTGNQFPNSGNLILLVDGPQQGLLWEVRQINVGGSTVTATPPGTAFIFACSAPPADLSMTVARDFTTTAFPAKSTWGTGVFKVRPPANLYVVITGGTPGLSYAATADINEYPDTPLMATVGTE